MKSLHNMKGKARCFVWSFKNSQRKWGEIVICAPWRQTEWKLRYTSRKLQPPHSFVLPYLQTNTNISMRHEGEILTWSTSAVRHGSPLSNGASTRCSPVDLSGLLRSLPGWASRLSPLVVRIFDRSSKTKRFRRQQKAEASLLQWTRDW